MKRLSTLAIDIDNLEMLSTISDTILRQQIASFFELGFVIIKNGVSKDLCALLKQKVTTGFGGALNCTYWDHDGIKKVSRFSRDLLDRRELKILDAHVHDSDVIAAIFSKSIVEFLKNIFGAKPVAFQSLAFIHGSEQPVHDDRTFVPVDPPGNLIASWIALEDVQPGSGELVYVPQSHLLPPHVFKDGSLSRWQAGELDSYTQSLAKKAKEANLASQCFIAEVGDVLLWHSALLHGGAPIRDRALTRHSLVTHYCPFSCVPAHARGVYIED